MNSLTDLDTHRLEQMKVLGEAFLVTGTLGEGEFHKCSGVSSRSIWSKIENRMIIASSCSRGRVP